MVPFMAAVLTSIPELFRTDTWYRSMGKGLDDSLHDTSTELSLMFVTFTGAGLSGGAVGT